MAWLNYEFFFFFLSYWLNLWMIIVAIIEFISNNLYILAIISQINSLIINFQIQTQIMVFLVPHFVIAYNEGN